MVHTHSSEPYEAQPTEFRGVIWYELGNDPVSTPVIRAVDLTGGSTVNGPAIVEFADTTLALRQGQRAHVDGWSSLVVETSP